MKLMVTMLAGLVMATFTEDAKADDMPKRSPELQVLDRLIGVWNVKTIIKPAGGPEIKREFVSRRRWTLGGTFLQFEDALNLSDPDAKEFQLLWTYDPVAKNYPAVIMDGPSRAELTGTWDAKTTTMHWTGKSSDGGTSKGGGNYTPPEARKGGGAFAGGAGRPKGYGKGGGKTQNSRRFLQMSRRIML